MYKRLIILSVIIAAALCGLTLLGYHAVEKWAEGLEWARLGEFAEVAEQIRQDVERKLDEFIRTEEDRPYTHYQDYYVPENVAAGRQEVPVLVSPLSGRMENYFASGYFQIEPDGRIVTANDDILQRNGRSNISNVIYAQTQLNRRNIETNLVPALTGAMPDSFGVKIGKKITGPASVREKVAVLKEAKRVQSKSQMQKDERSRALQGRRGGGENYYPIESLKRQDRAAQAIEQRRVVYEYQITSNMADRGGGGLLYLRDKQGVRSAKLNAAADEKETVEKGLFEQKQEVSSALHYNEGRQLQKMESSEVRDELLGDRRRPAVRETKEAEQAKAPQTAPSRAAEQVYIDDMDRSQIQIGAGQDEIVKGRKGPFVTYVVGGGEAEKSIFGKQVFLVRDVQIEDRQFRQGFQLNEKKLIEEVNASAAQFIRDGMGFELSQREEAGAVHAAILDFGFGNLVLNLEELDPGWVGKQISQLRTWYFSIITIVLLAVTVGLVSLWRYARAQMKLAEKKDDFISAVSHELRTPLTSIRMYSEMLENKWVKSEDKVAEYHRNMRQESERLSRLIENVLDFSRIQRGRKKYTFSVGDINECIGGVVEVMTPYAAQNGFSIKTELEQLGHMAFDKDAVKQIIVNLLDNAIKYARNAEDKIITVRTKSDTENILIEVEDHGPGVPHRQRKKIFEEFYRLGSEATRETRGTGLGLALVKRFAQAHNGFVEILAAKPAGAIFRVGLAMQP